MNESPKLRWLFAAFPFAGLLSALLASILPRLGFFGIGGIFGASIAACFWLVGSLRSVWKTLIFIAASMTALTLAILSTVNGPGIQLFSWVDRGWGLGPEEYFVGGAVGAAVILAATLFLLFPAQAVWRILAKAAGWSLVGGLLGFVATAREPLFQWRGSNFAQLFVVWQTGMASLLGLLVRMEQRTSHEVSRDGGRQIEMQHGQIKTLSVWGWLFSLLIVALLVYFIFDSVQSRNARQRFQKEQEQSQAILEEKLRTSIAAAPSRENLSRPPETRADLVLILSSIGDWVPFSPVTQRLPSEDRPVGRTALRPPRMSYTVEYGKRGDPRDRCASITVVSYPNSDWAEYELRNIPQQNEAVLNPEKVKRVTESGNVIVVVTEAMPFHSYWVSGTSVIWLQCHCGPAARTMFLKEYLSRYPSSLKLP
jgi:hypothetical protein